MVPAAAEWVYFQKSHGQLFAKPCLCYGCTGLYRRKHCMVLSVLSLGSLLSKVQEQVVISPGTPSFSSAASHVQWFLSAFTVRSQLQTLVLSCLTTTLLLVSDFVSDAKVLSKQVDCFFFSC